MGVGMNYIPLMRTELLNKWIREVNLLLTEVEKLPDRITRQARTAMLKKLRDDLVLIRDGVK